MLNLSEILNFFNTISKKIIFKKNKHPKMAGKIRDINNPVVFFDFQIGTYKAGRVKMELFADVVPKTAENFR